MSAAIDLDAIERRAARRRLPPEWNDEYARIMAARGEPIKPLSKPKLTDGRFVGKGRKKRWERTAKKKQKAKPASRVTRRAADPDERPKKVYTTPQGKAYEAYINSKAWAKVRADYWRRHGYSCKAKGCGASTNLHVHHHTYERLGNERMSDLLGLCHEHHDAVHAFHAKNRSMTLTEATSRVVSVEL